MPRRQKVFSVYESESYIADVKFMIIVHLDGDSCECHEARRIHMSQMLMPSLKKILSSEETTSFLSFNS
jgi:hypothetical protein